MEAPVKTVLLLDSLKRGGVQQCALELATRLDPARFDARVWVLRDGGPNRQMEDAFRRAPAPLDWTPVHDLNDRRGLTQLARRLRAERIVLLNTLSMWPNLAGRAAAAMAGVPVVVTAYHNTYEHKWDASRLAYERALAPVATLGICVSETVRRVLVGRVGLDGSRLAVVPNGLDLEALKVDASREQLRRDLDLPPTAPVVVSLGRLTAVKDVATFLRAVGPVREALPEAVFLVVGDGDERAGLERLAMELGLKSPTVRFLGTRGDAPAILKTADCMVLTSRNEGFGLVIGEAMASRTPIVTTPSDAVAELVQDGQTALFAPFGDPPAVARAIVRTLTETQETARRVRRAAEGLDRFDLDAWAGRNAAVFERALALRAPQIERFQQAGPELAGARALAARLRLRFRYRMARILGNLTRKG